jgi:hypothetical protein
MVNCSNEDLLNLALIGYDPILLFHIKRWLNYYDIFIHSFGGFSVYN